MTIASTKVHWPEGGATEPDACTTDTTIPLRVEAGNHYFYADTGHPKKKILARFAYAETGTLIVTVTGTPNLTPIYRNGRRITNPDANELVIVPPGEFRFKASALGSGSEIKWAIGNGTWVESAKDLPPSNEPAAKPSMTKKKGKATRKPGPKQVTQLQVSIKREPSGTPVSCE